MHNWTLKMKHRLLDWTVLELQEEISHTINKINELTIDLQEYRNEVKRRVRT